MPRLLFNTIALDPHRWTAGKVAFFNLEDLLPRLAAYGFRRLEVWPYHLVRRTGAERAALHRQAADLGVTMPVVGLYAVLHRGGPDGRADHAAALRVLDAAAEAGAGLVKLFVGNRASSALSEAERARTLAALRALAEAARARGLRLAGETHADTLFDTPAAVHRAQRALGADALAICFQPFSFTDTASAVADFAALAPQVALVHLQGRRDDAIVPLAEAEIDYDALVAAFAAHGFGGDLSLEFVHGGIVARAADLDVEAVLRQATRDRAFVAACAARHGLALAV